MTKQIKSIKDLGENDVIKCTTEQEVLELCKTFPYTNVSPLGVLKANKVVYLGIDSWYSHTGPNTTIHPASSFLPESFYQVEPKAGQLWECINNVMPPFWDDYNYFNHKFTIGKPYKLQALEDNLVWRIEDDRGTDVFIDVDGRNHSTPIELSQYFRFHSHPKTETMYPTEETTLNTKEEETINSTIEIKKGQIWECYNPALVPIGNTVAIVDFDETHVRFFNPNYTEGKMELEYFYDYFKFHSEPNTTNDSDHVFEHERAIQGEWTEPISERKAASFRFYDQLPPELARQAKENFREDACKNVPTNLFEAIQYGWWWSESKHGNFSSWCRVRDNAQNGKYNLSEAHSSVIIDPMKHELLTKVFEELDEQGKSIMRKHFSSLFPKVKEYVRRFDWHYSSDYVNLNTEETINMPLVLLFKNCTPEIVGNEIRFVKD